MLSIGLNKMNHRNRLGIYTLNSLLAVQFKILKNAMNLTEHWTIQDMWKCYKNTLVCYFS